MAIWSCAAVSVLPEYVSVIVNVNTDNNEENPAKQAGFSVLIIIVKK
jgi:hypothetical protein